MDLVSRLLLALLALGVALRMWKASRRRFAWGQTAALAGGSIAVTAGALAALWFGMRQGGERVGLAACLLVLAGGLAAVITAAKRRWPPP